jgi:hypothetical protein
LVNKAVNALAKLGEGSNPLRNKSIIWALVAALLAGCSSSNVTPPLAPQNIIRIAQVSVNGPTTRHLTVLSVFGRLNIGGIVSTEVVNGNCTLYDRRPRLAVGCRVISATSAFVRGSSFQFYTGSNATSCIAASGQFRGRISRGAAIPVVFRWTGNC